MRAAVGRAVGRAEKRSADAGVGQSRREGQGQGQGYGRVPVPAIELANLGKTYPGGVVALHDVSLTVERGTFLAVMGPSGSGKSTLMHCAAGLDAPTGGSVRIDGQEIGGLNENRRTELRRERIGFVFQSYNLVPSLSVADNITLPLRLAGRAPDRQWLHALTERVGLSDRLSHRPAELSGGQQQRAAIVRALVAKPAVVFADEPTGALDLRSAHGVLNLLRELVDELGQTVVMVTHDPAAAAQAHEALVMADGRVVDTLRAPTAPQLAARLVSLGEN
ncbi:ABC transporter ATP-binding protein [Streptomyces sp. NPDC057137]|uniref:ABC transporter ATP-binding protein n=1 Tax=Streptomyces sp. NPDC057137 TaxID=3346030 RepID=UPI00363FBCE4